MDDPADGSEPGPPRLRLAAGGVATITLNRPRHLNRLHREDLAMLQRHFTQLAQDPAARVLVLTGSGRAFSAGFHLGELDESADATDDPEQFERTVEQLEALPLPTVARLNGSVYGGATDLALACDFRVGVHGMELRMPAARLGLHYYASGLQRAVERLGPSTAKRLFLLAEAVPAAELLRLGWLDRLVEPHGLDAEIDALTLALSSNAPLAVRAMKASLDEIAGGRADPQAMNDREARGAASADLREGLAAYAERRPPRFTGH